MMQEDKKSVVARIAGLDGDRIAEAWEQLDLLGMWIRLGAVSLPGHDQKPNR
jgi:hypothetical protein